MTQSQNPGCFPPTCVVAINEAGTGYSYSDRQTSWDEPGLGYHSGWRHPAWVDNDMTMLVEPDAPPEPRHHPRPHLRRRQRPRQHGHELDVGHRSTSNPHVSGGDITRDKRKLAYQTGENDSTLTVSYVPAFPTSWKDGDPNTDEDPRLLPLQRPGGRRLRRSVVLAGRRRDRLPRRRRHPRRGRPAFAGRLHARRRHARARRSSSPAASSPTGAPPTSRRPRTADQPATTNDGHATTDQPAEAALSVKVAQRDPARRHQALRQGRRARASSPRPPRRATRPSARRPRPSRRPAPPP